MVSSTMTVRWKLVLIFIAIFGFKSNRSVILEPRFHSTRPDLQEPTSTTHPKEHDPVDIPYIVSINEGESIQVETNSKSAITVNLNKAVPEDVVIAVNVHSGPGLIIFDNGNLTSSNNTSQTNITITFEANHFGDKPVQFHTRKTAGHAELVCEVSDPKPKNITIDVTNAYISVNIGKSQVIDVIINIVGWIYFFAWSLSFYFQVVLNYQRKSVVGLNFDFLALNLLGFTCYSIYNFALKFSRQVQKDYYVRNHYSRIPVEYNDLFFAVHAFLLTSITVIQCLIYERGNQKVSIPAGSFVGLTSILGLILYIVSLFDSITILDVVLYLSYVKLAITVIKYTPQAYMNYKRQATTGWSIHNILLDFTGGLFSIAQMFLIAFNYDDWISIFGNFTKFGLGVVSIVFDILFVVQHYILYNRPNPPVGATTEDESSPAPVISQSLRDGVENYQAIEAPNDE